MERGGCVYILTNKNNNVLYVGVTSRLRERVWDHKNNTYGGRSFTARYKVKKLVYYHFYLTIVEAIAREKQLKAGSRKKKIDLINGFNPEWRDLFDEIED